MKQDSIKKRILTLIRQQPHLANDDVALLAAVWRDYGWDDGVSLEDNIQYLPHAETVSRRRRDLFNEGLITYSDKALEMREHAFKEERDRASIFSLKRYFRI